ncbi:hypothetical protein FQN54_009627 [Arachnomyces sp. PD_36]|nr:hypothetical protein FQN54_009627 [Arachnomyces sp. PD_36]
MCILATAYISYCNHETIELCPAGKVLGPCPRLTTVIWPLVGWCSYCLVAEKGGEEEKVGGEDGTESEEVEEAGWFTCASGNSGDTTEKEGTEENAGASVSEQGDNESLCSWTSDSNWDSDSSSESDGSDECLRW